MFRFWLLTLTFKVVSLYPLNSSEIIGNSDPVIIAGNSNETFPIPFPLILITPKVTNNTLVSKNVDGFASIAVKCAINEELKACGSACPRSCAIPAPSCKSHCIKDICQCKEGFVVSHNGTCIPPSDCPVAAIVKKCPLNSHLSSCGSVCAPTCDQPTPSICTLQCIIDDCVCDEGYILDSQHRCIKPEDCPKKQKTCGINEKFHECGTPCEPSCDEPFPAFCSDECIKNACQCAEGFVRDDVGKCVLVTECLL